MKCYFRNLIISRQVKGTLSTRRKCNNSFYFSLVQKNLEQTDADMRVFGKRNYATCLSVKKSPNSNVRNAPLGSFSLTHSTNSFKIAWHAVCIAMHAMKCEIIKTKKTISLLKNKIYVYYFKNKKEASKVEFLTVAFSFKSLGKTQFYCWTKENNYCY